MRRGEQRGQTESRQLVPVVQLVEQALSQLEQSEPHKRLLGDTVQ